MAKVGVSSGKRLSGPRLKVASSAPSTLVSPVHVGRVQAGCKARGRRIRASLDRVRICLLFLFYALAPNCLGCAAPEEPKHFSFTFEGAPAERVAFVEALEEWRACGVRVELVDAGGIPVGPAADLGGHAGWTGLDAEGAPVALRYLWDPPHTGRYRQVLAHELGHALRGDLTHASHGLMAPSLVAEEFFADCTWLQK